MSSTLAEQLLHTQRLQGTAAAAKKARGKPSLLFDAQKAADVDGETIYQIGCQGLAELCCLNQAYGALREALFSRSAASLVRDQQQPEALAQLDAAIHEFCSLLAQHFLAPCAFKALEYLIRRFKANEHNASSLLLAGLPYHATNEFVLLVKTIPLEATRGLWGWLAPIQTSGASLARSTLVARCINDAHLLTWLGEAAKKLGTWSGKPSSVFLSFYATTMCEIIAETKVLDQEQVTRLLPCISYGLEAGASIDYRSATLMIVASLASRTTLSKDMAKALVNSMLRSHPSRRGMDSLLLRVLALVCAKQPELKRIPDKALKALSQLPSLDQELLTLARDGVKTSALLNRMASSLVKRMASHPEEAGPVLLKLVQAGVLEQVAEKLASQLLEQACPEDSSEEVSAGLLEATQQVLQALDTHYPTQTDTAVNGLLAATKPRTAANATKGESSGEEEEEAGDKEEAGQSQRAKAVFTLVQSTFGHTAHVPCGDQAMTLTAAVTSPAAEVRKMALQQIGELLESGTATPAATGQMHACILKGLEDEDPQVVAVVIALPSLRQLPIAALLPVVTPTALRASATFFTPTSDDDKLSKSEKQNHEATRRSTKAARKQARAVLVGALELLGTLAAGTGPGGSTSASEAVQKELTDLALLLGLQCLLPVSHSITLCLAAAECLSSLSHPLLAQLSQLTTAAAKLQAEEAVMKSETAPIDKTGRKAWAARRAAAVNTAERSILKAVAQAVAEELTTIGPELSRVIAVSRTLDTTAGSAVVNSNPALLRSRHVLTLAVNVALARAVKAGRKNPAAAAAAADLSQRLLHIALNAAASSDGTVSPEAWSDLIDKAIDSAGLPTEEHAQQLQAQPLPLQQALVHYCLLAALSNLPAGSDANGVDLLVVFSQVASLEPQGDYDQHLALLINRVCIQPQQRAEFLASIYCNPGGEGVQPKDVVVVAALRLAGGIAALSMHHVAHVTTPVKTRPASQQASAAALEALGGTTAEVTQAVMAHLPHMIAATCAASEAVRLAALDALLTVREALAVVPPATHPGVPAMAELLSCLQTHEQWITTDSTAVVTLIRAALAGQQPALPTTAVPSTPTKGGKRSGGKSAAAGPSTTDAALALFAQLLPHLAGSPQDLVAADTLIQCLVPEQGEGNPGSAAVAGGAVTAGACLELLRAILSAAPRPLVPVQQRAAARALHVAFAPTAQPASASASAAKVFLLALAASSVSSGAPAAAEPAWFDSMSAVRLAAIRCMSSGQIPALLHQEGEAGAQLSAAVVQSLAVSAAGDVSIACRQAARAALEAIPITATSITSVLHAAQQQQQQQWAAVNAAPEADTPVKKKKQKKDVAAATVPAAAVPIELAPPSLLEQAVLMLELLQWKAVSGEEQVVFASQELLSALQPTIAPLSQPHGTIRADPDSALTVPGSDDDDELNNANGRVNMPDAASSSSLAGYAAQLILQSLAGAAQRLGATSQPAADAAAEPAAAGDSKKVPGSTRKASHKAAHAEAHGMDVFDLELVVRVAQAAPDGAARNAALSLLAQLAGLAPQRAIKHVLEVLALVNASASTSDDAHSQQVAATTMASVVPTWVASGQDIMQLWEAVVAALPAMPAHRRLPLLATLLTAARTEAAALPTGLLALLAHVVRVQEAKVAAKKAGPEGAEEVQGKEDEGEWGLELTAQLANQVPLQQRIQAFAALLRLVVQSERGQAHTPLARLAVTFITGQLQSKAVAGSALDHQQDEALQPACESLMAAALDCIRRLVAASGAAGADVADNGQPVVAAATKGKGKATTPAGGVAPVTVGRKEERAVRTSIKGVYTLFEALQVVMPPHSYLQALLRLASQPVDRVRKRALRLFADRAARLPTDLKRIAEHPAYAAKAKAAAAQRLAQAALQIVPLVEQLAKELDAPSSGGNDPAAASALTHQSALAALSHVTTACGAGHAEVILAVIPSVLAHLRHSNGAVRGEALAVLASAVKACGAQLLPQLPATAKAIVAAGEAAAAASETEPAAARKRGKSQAEGGAQEEDVEGEEKESGGQLAAVELLAALGAIGALVSQLGAFISPYLPAMLRVLLHPAVLSCQSAGCAAAAATVRASLPVSVPSRLLLEPLFAALPNAAEHGLLPVQALLSVVTVAVQRMDPTAAAAHADAVFAFLLRVLDMRSTPTPALKGLEHEAEASAVQALVALTLKLSEVRFKPLFLRFLEWASSPTASIPAGTAVGPNLGRLISLFTAAAALSEKLRSVFVPYFRHLIDLAVRHLTPQQHAAASKGSAKKRKQAGDAVLSPEATTPEWVLRIKIVRALHRCFLYDSVGWLDAEKVARLLPPLVAQLKEAPPAGTAAAAVAVQCRDRELDASVKFAERSPREDVAGVAAVAALVQMAVAANSDVHWKPLNYQVLMTTRTGGTRTRCLALEVVAHMVERLREEYLVMLPETLAFLSELLEDPDVAVESRVKQILASLEELGGEKLDQYLKK